MIIIKIFIVFLIFTAGAGCLPGLLVMHEVGDTVRASRRLYDKRNELLEKYPQAYDRYCYQLMREGRKADIVSYQSWLDLQALTASERNLLLKDAERRGLNRSNLTRRPPATPPSPKPASPKIISKKEEITPPKLQPKKTIDKNIKRQVSKEKLEPPKNGLIELPDGRLLLR